MTETDFRLLGFPVQLDTTMPRYAVDLVNPSGQRIRITFGVQSDPLADAQVASQGTASAAGSAPDVRVIVEALGFDPTNHHNALVCAYCNPDRLTLGVPNETPETPMCRCEHPGNRHPFAAGSDSCLVPTCRCTMFQPLP